MDEKQKHDAVLPTNSHFLDFEIPLKRPPHAVYLTDGKMLRFQIRIRISVPFEKGNCGYDRDCQANYKR